MTIPTATTEMSATRAELQQFFESFASKAFDRCWQAHSNANYYKKLLADVQNGRVLSAELEEAKGLSNIVVLSVLQQQYDKAVAAAESAWELSPNVATEFRTTLRSNLPEGESVPQYDIEYQAKSTQDSVKVSIKTWRRNIRVELIASRSALDELHRKVMMAGLR